MNITAARKLVTKIEKKYGSIDSEWVLPSGKVHECREIKELALALEKMCDEVENANQHHTAELNRRVAAERSADAAAARNRELVARIDNIKSNITDKVTRAIDSVKADM